MNDNAERVGPAFSVDGMLHARNQTRQAIRAIAAMVEPGMAEEHAVEQAKQILLAQGHALSWHPTRVRFGKNTTKPMKQPSEPGVVLQENDIFFSISRPGSMPGKATAALPSWWGTARNMRSAQRMRKPCSIRCGRSGATTSSAAGNCTNMPINRPGAWAGS